MGNICMSEFSPSDLQKQFLKINLEIKIMLAVRCLGFFLSVAEIISSWKRETKLNIYFLLN